MPNDENTQGGDSLLNQDTNQNQANSAPQSVDEHAGQNNEQANIDASPQTGHEDSPNNDFERIKSKAAKLESENAQLAKDREAWQQAQSSLSAVARVLAGSPDAYATFQSSYNRTYADQIQRGEIEALPSYNEWMRSQGNQTTSQGQSYSPSQNQQSSGNQNIDPTNVRSLVREELQENNLRTERQVGFEEFVQAVPKMDPKNFTTAAEKQQANEEFGQVALIAESIKMARGVNYGQAYKMAWNTLHPDESIKAAQETGRMMGQADALASGAGVSSGVSGQHSGSTGGGNEIGSVLSKLTDAQRAHYEKLKKTGKAEFADKFARNAVKYAK